MESASMYFILSLKILKDTISPTFKSFFNWFFFFMILQIQHNLQEPQTATNPVGNNKTSKPKPL